MLWKRKTKEQKIIEEMKQKKAQIDKLKEEMNNMAKLVLRDGKLQKVEDTPKVEAPKEERILPPIAPLSPPSPPPRFNRNPQQEMEQEIRQEMLQRRMAQEQYMRDQEELRQQQYQQPILPPMPPPPQMYQQPTQYSQYQQPMYQQPVYQQPIPEVNIQLNIEMTNGTVIKLAIPSSRYDNFIMELENAINQQTTLTLNNRVINGRNVVSYFVE